MTFVDYLGKHSDLLLGPLILFVEMGDIEKKYLNVLILDVFEYIVSVL